MFIDRQIQRLRQSSDDAQDAERGWRGGQGNMKFMLLLRLTFKFFSFKLNKKNKTNGKKWEKNNKKKEINKTKHFLRALPLNKVADNSYNNNNVDDVADELAWNPPSGQVMLPKTLPRAAAFLLRFRLSSDACVLLVILLGSRETGGEGKQYSWGRGSSSMSNWPWGFSCSCSCRFCPCRILTVIISISIWNHRACNTQAKPSRLWSLLLAVLLWIPHANWVPAVPFSCARMCVWVCAGTAAAACSNCIDLRGEKHRPCRWCNLIICHKVLNNHNNKNNKHSCSCLLRFKETKDRGIICFILSSRQADYHISMFMSSIDDCVILSNLFILLV